MVLKSNIGKTVDYELPIKPFPWQQREIDTNKGNTSMLGGARGPGKSMLLTIKLLLFALRYPNATMLCIGTQLNTVIKNIKGKLETIYPEVIDGQRMWTWHDKMNMIRFKNGTELTFGHTKSLVEFKKAFHGSSQDFIGVDDGGDISPDILGYLESISRLSDPLILQAEKTGEDIQARIYITSNPLGISHVYLKETFVDVWTKWCKGKAKDGGDLNNWKVPVLKPDGTQALDKKGRPAFRTYSYFPAKVTDNPVYKDTEYEWKLMMLPERLRKGYLDGDWSVSAGGMFSDFIEEEHVNEMIEPVQGWKKVISIDFGFSDGIGVIFYQQDPKTKRWQAFDEMAGNKIEFDDLSMRILDYLQINGLYEDVEKAILVWDMWNGSNRGYYTENGLMGENKAEAFETITGLRAVSAGKPARKDKWEQLHKALKLRDSDKEKTQIENVGQKALIQFSPRCKHTINQLKFTQVDPQDPTDIVPMRDENNIKYDHHLDSLATFTWIELRTEVENTYTFTAAKEALAVAKYKEDHIQEFWKSKQTSNPFHNDVDLLNIAFGRK